MANEFIIKNGFYSNGNSAITGSLIVSASGATNDLQIGTNKLFVSAAGNVGIGTTTPSAKLTVQVTGSAANALVANFIKSPAASNETGSTFIRISTYPALITGSGLYTDIEFNSGYQGPFRYGTYADTNIINGTHSTTGNYGSINFVTSGSIGMTIAGGTSAGRVGIGTTTPNATLDVSGSAIISGSLTTTSSVAFKAYTSATSFPGTAVGYLAFDTAGNIITKEGVGAFPYTGSAQITGSLDITGSLTTTGSVVFSGLTSNITSNVVYIEPTTKQLSYGISKNIGNSDLTIDFDTTRVLYHDGLSQLIISKSEAPSAVLELKNTSTGGNKVLVMEQLLDSNANRGGNRQFTAGGDSPNSATFNGYAMDSIVEYLSGSSGSTNKLQGWKWSYYNGVDYANVLLISTSNAAVLNATLDVNGNTKITGSLIVTQGITGSLNGTASFAATASNVQGGTARYIPIWNTSSSLSSSAIYQSATGNVGINITNPLNTLTIVATTASVRLQESSVSSKRLDFSVNADGVAKISANQSSQKIAFETVGDERMRITNTGNVGIGTTTPNATLDVNGNTIITGSLIVTNDFTVLGSASIQYITSSQLNIADNLITVNTYSPTFRFGGIAVIDSGSGTPFQSGSLLFDSEQDEWKFVHKSPGASPTTSSLLIMGPESYDLLGSEIHPTTNRIMKSLNDEHIGDSNITDTGTIVSINSNTEITGSLTVTGSAIISGSTTVNGALSITSGSSVSFTSSNSSYSGRMHVSNLPNPLGTSTVSSPLYNYGAASEGLYIQFGESSDVGGIKITDDGVAVFGAGDNDLFKVVNEDTNQQIFVINDLNQVGINKAFTPGANSAMNATLDVNGNTIITGSLTVTGSYVSPAGNTINSNALIQASLLYLSNNF